MADKIATGLGGKGQDARIYRWWMQTCLVRQRLRFAKAYPEHS